MGETENAALVLMLKDAETGLFKETLGQYQIEADESLIEGFCAEESENGAIVCLRLGTGNVWGCIGDDLYGIIYDEYDADFLPSFIDEFIEIDGRLNPVWEARFPFAPSEAGEMAGAVLAAHKKELEIIRAGLGTNP